jgi:hypothetical protein
MSEPTSQTASSPESSAQAAPPFADSLAIGLSGERKAFALLCLAFYTAFFGLLSLLLWNAPPDQAEVRAWWGCFAALAGCYGLSFFSLGAGWFWARWFAMGLGYSGVTVAFWSVVTQRTIDPVIAFYGATHGIILLFLQGKQLTAEFDAKPGWRKALGLDENGVQRVRATVTRAAASLPTLILIALAPREGGEGLLAAALGVLGLWGLLRARTVGALALLAAAPLTLLSGFHAHSAATGGAHALIAPDLLHLLSLSAGLVLLSAALPFVRPMLRFLGRPAA